MCAGLCRGQNPRAAFDRAGAQQAVPMRGPRDRRKRRRIDQNLRPGLHQRPRQMTKAHVVTSGHTQPETRHIGHHGTGAGPIASGFAIGLAFANLHIEHMDLVVARANVAIRPDQKLPVGKASVRVVRLDRERSDQQPDTMRRRLRPQSGQRDVRCLVLQDLLLTVAAGRDAVCHLGGQDELRPRTHRSLQQG